MIQKIDEATMAELRHEFRELYKNLGLEGCYQVLYEILMSGSTLAEVINEEQTKGKKAD